MPGNKKTQASPLRAVRCPPKGGFFLSWGGPATKKPGSLARQTGSGGAAQAAGSAWPAGVLAEAGSPNTRSKLQLKTKV